MGWTIKYKDDRDTVLGIDTFEGCLDILFSQHAYCEWVKNGNGIFSVTEEDDTEIACVSYQWR